MIRKIIIFGVLVFVMQPLFADLTNAKAKTPTKLTKKISTPMLSPLEIASDKIADSIDNINDSLGNIKKEKKGFLEKYVFSSLVPVGSAILAFMFGLFAHEITERRKKKKEDIEIIDSYKKIKKYIEQLPLVPNLPIGKWRELVDKIPSGLSADEEMYITAESYKDLDSIDIPVSRYNDYFVELGLVKVRILNEMVKKHLKKTESHISDNVEEIVYVSESISHLLQSVDESNEKRKSLDFNKLDNDQYIEKRETIAREISWYINSVILRLRTMRIIKSSVFSREYSELPEL